MKLRIVAGRYRGRRIEAPPGRATRPTREAVREAWFSALGTEVERARVLDLFAGSGALGLEALSRGAESVHFVEADRGTCAVLRENLRRLGAEAAATVTCGPVFPFLERLASRGGRAFDIAVADPPYGTDDARRIVTAFQERPFAGILCVEHAPEALSIELAMWHRRYGHSALTFFGSPREGASGEE